MDFREFRRRHRSFLVACGIVVLAMLALDGWMLAKRSRYEKEIARLRGGMSEVERKRTDLVISTEQHRTRTMLALMRRQAQIDKQLHLSISVDSGRMYLEREGAVLREMPVQIGAERRVGVAPDTVHLAVPRGTFRVEKILDGAAGWQVPKWVYADRGLGAPAERTVRGALGPVALVLNGGAVVYTAPTAGPLNDTSYVLPGSVRARSDDLKAILPNLKEGMAVYFY